jgi:hypothetical protein
MELQGALEKISNEIAAKLGGSSSEVNLTVPQNFELQTVFDKWFAKKKSDGAFLFQDHGYTQKLLGRWNVQYEGELECYLVNFVSLSRHFCI